MTAEPYTSNWNHREYVAHGADYDATGREVFDLLIAQGLQPQHRLLDYGCGSLRVGKHIIGYLEPEHYFGLEPQTWLVLRGIEEELEEVGRLERHPFFAHPEIDSFDVNMLLLEFDYILISGVMAHADHAQIATMLASAKDALAPGGRIIASYHPVGDPHHVLEGWLYPNVAPHPRDCFMSLTLEAGLNYQELGYDTGKAMWVRLE